MDGVLCHHMTPRRSAQGPGGVPGGGPLDLPPIRADGGLEAERPVGGGDPGGDHSGGTSPRRTSNITGGKYWGLSDSAAVHGERDRSGCAGMTRCPLPTIWPRAPRPPPFTVTDATPKSKSIMPLIAREAASSRCVITISGTGLQTWPEKHSPPLTCTTTPSSSQVAP